MTKGLRKDFRREVKHSFSRFLSILLISALGVAFFAGIRSASPAMLASADATFDSDNLADIRVIGTLGLTDNDVAALLSLEGVQAAEGIYTGDFLCETENNTVVAKVTSMTNQVSLVKVKEGRYPEKYNCRPRIFSGVGLSNRGYRSLKNRHGGEDFRHPCRR